MIARMLAAAAAAAIGAGMPSADVAREHPPARAHVALYQGHTIRWWANRAALARREANELRAALEQRRRRTLATDEPIYEHAARLAAIAYGVDPDTLIRKGRCESVDWTKFANASSSARGPWQFLTTGTVRRYGDHALVDGGTWATTPFYAFSPFDPLAAAMAAAWMHAQGRGGEWVCQ